MVLVLPSGKIAKLSENEVIFLNFLQALKKNAPERFEEDGVSITIEEIGEATGLEYYFQASARKKLVAKHLLKEKFRGLPRKLYFSLDDDAVKKMESSKEYEIK